MGLRHGLTFPLPTALAVGHLDRQTVDAGAAEFQAAGFVELPVLLAAGAIPLAGVAGKSILAAHGDAVAGVSPEFLLQSFGFLSSSAMRCFSGCTSASISAIV